MADSLINSEVKDSISVFDRGLHYGDGVFETMAVRNGEIALWDDHWERLSEGCLRLSITKPDKISITNDINKLCDNHSDNPDDNKHPFIIKLIVTRGVGKRGYRYPEKQNPTHILLSYPIINHPSDFQTKGVAVRYCDTLISENKQLAGIKHLNRLEQVLARNEWDNTDYQEGLMLNTHGFVVDGTMSNVFAVKGQLIMTPDLSFAGVAGVMRKTILRMCKDLGLELKLTNISPSELEAMDEVFLSNSIFGIWPVNKISTKKISTGAVTQRLQVSLNKRLGI